MHPRQAKLITEATEVAAALEPKTALAPMLWMYTPPDGPPFYLTDKLTTIKSPWSGRTFTVQYGKNLERINPSSVGRQLRDLAETPVVDPMTVNAEEEPKVASEDPWKA